MATALEPNVIIDNDFWHVSVIDGDQIRVRERVPFVIGGYKWMTIFEGDICDPKLAMLLEQMLCAHDALAARIDRVSRRRKAAEAEDEREPWYAGAYPER